MMTRMIHSTAMLAFIAGAGLACSSSPEPQASDRPSPGPSAEGRAGPDRLDGPSRDPFLSPSVRAAPRLLDRLLDDFLAAHPATDDPVIAVRALRNATDEHLDTRVLKDRCTAALNRGGYQVSLPPSRLREELDKTEADQPGSVWTPPALMMHGQVSSIRRKSKTEEVVETIFELKVTRIADGRPIWSGRQGATSSRLIERR